MIAIRNCVCIFGVSALNGDVQRVKHLLDKGHECNASDISGYTALHYACRNGHLKVCEVLISEGADVNASTHAGSVVPLHRASYAGHTEIVKLLLKNRANSTLCDIDGKCALHKAAAMGHKDICELLLSMNPSLKHVKDNYGRTPIDDASNADLLDTLHHWN